MIRIASIVRKSPTNKGVKENIQDQITANENWADNKYGKNNYNMVHFIDKNVSGDADLEERPELARLFANIDSFDVAVTHRVDRFSRSYLGIKWFYEYFSTARGSEAHLGCKLYFATEVPEMYDADNFVILSVFFSFSMMCMFAQYDLMKIRGNTQRGIDRLTKEQRKQKYQGRKVGVKNKRTKEIEQMTDKQKELFEIARLYVGGCRPKEIMIRLKVTSNQVAHVREKLKKGDYVELGLEL